MIHVYSPKTLKRIQTKSDCPDCKKDDVLFYSFYTEWHGWDHYCMSCERRWCDDEWMPFDFYRNARKDSLSEAQRRWDCFSK